MLRARARCDLVILLLASTLMSATAFGAPAPAPAGMDDITCYKPPFGQCSAGVPDASWAFGQVYGSSRAVCKLIVWVRPNNGQQPPEPRGVGTGWLVNFNNRADLIITNRHVVDPNFGYPAGTDEDDYDDADTTVLYRDPQWKPKDVFDHVEAFFDRDYLPDCQCMAPNPPAACMNAPQPCDTPETPDCRELAPWFSQSRAWPSDGADWAVVKVHRNVFGQLPGQLFPTLPLGLDATNRTAVIPQHAQGRCKEVAFGLAGGYGLNPWTLLHFVDTQSGSSGSPVLYSAGGFTIVGGVHYARQPMQPIKFAVRSQVIADSLERVVLRADLQTADHYMTYTVLDEVDPPIEVNLTDRFLVKAPFQVGRLQKLLVPVDKNHPPDVVYRRNPDLHYKWWALSPADPVDKIIRVQNQFSANTDWRLQEPVALLTPTFKMRGHAVPAPDTFPREDHYLCYRAVETGTHSVPIQLRDQFQLAGVVVRDAEYFCNPCIKERGGEFYPVVKDSIHLALYKIDPGWLPDSVTIRDQFAVDRVMIKQDGADQEYLVVPSRVTGVVLGFGEHLEHPGGVELGLPVPNPSGGGVTLDLVLQRSARAELAVFDGAGRQLRSIRAGVLPAGRTRLSWDGRTDRGKRAAVGVYYIRVRVEGAVLSRQVVIRR